MKKHIIDLRITFVDRLHPRYVLIKGTPADGSRLPEMLPGQFAQLKVEGSPETYLRRPISIHDVTSDTVTSTNKGEEVSFLIALAGRGTRQLATLKVGKPDCRCPKKSPGPRSFRSSSAILKPSVVLHRAFSRWTVSGLRLWVVRMQ